MIGVDVDGVSADVFVICVTAVFVIVVIAMVIGVVVAITVVVSAVVVSAVPGRVSVVRPAVIHDRRAMPATIPTAIPPTATSAAHHRPHSDSNTKPNNGGGGDVSRAIPRCHI